MLLLVINNLSYTFGLRLEKYRELKKVINLCIDSLIFWMLS